MPKAFRIVKAKRAGDAFSGEGARRLGGRWSSHGNRVVYTAGSASLATLEVLVHLDHAALILSYVLFEAVFDEELVTELEVDSLPPTWRDYPAPPELQQIGDDWIAGGSSAVLRVPSVVIPIERCYVLNPAHPGFSAIQRSGPVPFEFDKRLARG